MTSVSLIILILVFVPDIILGTEYQDCTSLFKNRVALFENKFYPGYWSFPGHEFIPDAPFSLSSLYGLWLGYNKNTQDAKSNNLYHWTLYDCGPTESSFDSFTSDNSTLCIRSNSEKYSGNWIRESRVTFDGHRFPEHVPHHNFHDVSNQTNSSFKHKIFCTHCSTDETFHNCRIINVGPGPGKYLYTSKTGFHRFNQNGEEKWKGEITSENESWFSWRIIAPETSIYWRQKIVDNCEGITDLPASITLSKSITTTDSTTHSVAQKIAIGFKAIKLLNLKVDSETTYTWTTTKTREYAEGSEVTIGNGKMVKPGWKWIVKQLVGTAAFAEISTDKYKSLDVKCNT